MKFQWCLLLLAAAVTAAPERKTATSPRRLGLRGSLSYRALDPLGGRNATAPPAAGATGATGATGVDAGSRIIGGHEAAPCQFPYQAALHIWLMDSRLALCGGSLITERLVLTAAHCVYPKFYKIDVILGIHNIDQDAGIKRSAERVFLHGLYDDEHLEYDIAVLQLDIPVTLSVCISPVDLDADGCTPDRLDGELATASGWGLVADGGNASDVLRWVDVQVIRNAVCEETYGSMLSSQMCSVSDTAAPKGLCSGDSGGPLVLAGTRTQIGINSFVHERGCESGNPHGYSRVSCFIDWINLVKAL